MLLFGQPSPSRGPYLAVFELTKRLRRRRGNDVFGQPELDSTLVAYVERFASKGCAYPDLCSQAIPLWADAGDVSYHDGSFGKAFLPHAALFSPL